MSAAAAADSKVAATADENTPNSENRYYQHNLFGSRRDFLKLAAVAASLPMLNIVFTSICSGERTSWYRNAKFGVFIH
jgi:hypothetical protein